MWQLSALGEAPFERFKLLQKNVADVQGRLSTRNWDHLQTFRVRETCVVDGNVQDRAVRHEFVGMVIFAVQRQAFEALFEAANMLKRVRGLYGLKVAWPLGIEEITQFGESF